MPPTPKFTAWPASHKPFTEPSECLAAYNAGWAGVVPDPAAAERVKDIIRQTSGYADLESAAHANDWADSGAGKLVIPFMATRKYWPNCWPGEAQQTGCCVSMSTRNALMVTLACELEASQPDPISGQMEGVPKTTPDGEKAGVFSNAPNYWYRGHGGGGWDCGSSVEVAIKYIGLVVAQNYPDLGVDLTHCTGRNDELYGSRRPPQEWLDALGTHKVRSAAAVNSFEMARDALANGYAITTCGGEGFSSSRNEDGVSRPQGSWSHAMAMLAADDREETKKKYGDGMVWIQNSWANWNSGPLRILNTTIDANPGGFWTQWSNVRRRSMYAFSNLVGWPPQKLPDYGGSSIFN